jgi:hypothetical protein
MGQIIRKVAFPPNPYATQAYVETQNRVLAHQISFGTTMGNTDVGNNMGCWKVENMATGVGANTEFAIPHNLTRIPIHFHGYAVDGGIIYSNYPGMTPWTAATPSAMGNIYVKCTTTGNIYLIIV